MGDVMVEERNEAEEARGRRAGNGVAAPSDRQGRSKLERESKSGKEPGMVCVTPYCTAYTEYVPQYSTTLDGKVLWVARLYAKHCRHETQEQAIGQLRAALAPIGLSRGVTAHGCTFRRTLLC
jgi:hypothetical protein